MPSGKRASMREGPLAALFRRTDTQASPEAGKPDAEQPREDTPREQAATEQGTPAAEGAEQAAGPTPGAETAGATAAADTTPASPNIPTPQERLRHAFSADIPENLMERSEPRTTPARASRPRIDSDVPHADPFAHAAERDIYSAPRPVGMPVLRVVGVGGAGVNAVNRMIEAEIEDIEFLAINTDLQSLQQSEAPTALHIGDGITRGLGSGSNPDLGRQAAMEGSDKIKAALKGSDMVFITAGAGGGTGTGAAPIVARIARELGALTVGIVTKPFGFEGSRRRDQADEGIVALGEEVDTLIVVPNNRLLSVLDKQTSMVEAFGVADDVLRQGVQGISDLVTLPGLINLDFADVRTIMSDAGNALLGIGMGTGERRAVNAAETAVASPLLETSMDGARSILLSITGGRDLSLWEVNEAARAVAQAAHAEANIIFGAMLDEKLEDQVWVTVVATGYVDPAAPRRSARPQLHEPMGEPRVRRASEAPRRRSLDIAELDVPEFIPRV